jgi:hypothetical protein
VSSGYSECFGCTRWSLGWPYRGLPFQSAFASDEAVAVECVEGNRRRAHDVGGVVEHDSEGRRWFRPKKLRRPFFLCTVCRYLFDNDCSFKGEIERKASGMREGGESP